MSSSSEAFSQMPLRPLVLLLAPLPVPYTPTSGSSDALATLR